MTKNAGKQVKPGLTAPLGMELDTKYISGLNGGHKRLSEMVSPTSHNFGTIISRLGCE